MCAVSWVLRGKKTMKTHEQLEKLVPDYQIPFDKDGNMQDYPSHWYEGEYPNSVAVGPDWRNNKVFYTTLKFTGFSRGRSSAKLDFLDLTNGKTVSFFMKEFSEAVPFMTRGYINGAFCFVKRGTNYGVKLLEEREL